MILSLAELIYLGVWAFIGSILGFFAFSYTPHKAPHENFCRGVLSVGVGLFVAFSVCTYLEEINKFSRHFDIILGGVCAFGLPDFIMKWWPKLVHAFAGRVVDKVIGDGVKCPSDWSKDKDKDNEGIG